MNIYSATMNGKQNGKDVKNVWYLGALGSGVAASHMQAIIDILAGSIAGWQHPSYTVDNFSIRQIDVAGMPTFTFATEYAGLASGDGLPPTVTGVIRLLSETAHPNHLFKQFGGLSVSASDGPGLPATGFLAVLNAVVDELVDFNAALEPDEGILCTTRNTSGIVTAHNKATAGTVSMFLGSQDRRAYNRGS